MFLDRFVRLLLPRQDRFFVLLDELALRITAAAAVFGELRDAPNRERIEAIAAKLKPIETDADSVCHKIYAELDRTFVTPIDREDLASLAKSLDDVIDGMEHTASFAALYRIDTLTEPMKQLVRFTTEAAKELAGAVSRLRSFGDPESIRDTTVRVHTLENEADAVYREAIAKLFSDGMNPIELVRQKDMLFSLEQGVDECEDAMDVIRSVIVKNG